MQFKSQDLCLTFIQILHHLHSSPKIPVSPTSKHHLNYKYSHLTFTLATPIQVPIFTLHHNPGHVSPQSRSLKLNPRCSPITTYSGLKMAVSTQSISHLTLSQVSRFTSLPQPGSKIYLSSSFGSRKRHLGCFQVTSNPSRYQNVDVKCFQVFSHLHIGPKILVSPKSMYRLTSIQVPRFHQ